LNAQIGLACVDGNQVRTQRQDPLDVRIEERADALEFRDFGRIAIEAADRDDLRALAAARGFNPPAD